MKIILFLLFLIILPMGIFGQSYFDFTTVTEDEVQSDLFDPLQSLLNGIATSCIKEAMLTKFTFGVNGTFLFFDMESTKSILNGMGWGKSIFPLPLIYMGSKIPINEKIDIVFYGKVISLQKHIYTKADNVFPSDIDNIFIGNLGAGVSIDVNRQFDDYYDDIFSFEVIPVFNFQYAKGMPYTDYSLSYSLVVIANTRFDVWDRFIFEFYLKSGMTVNQLKTTNLPVFNKSFDVDYKYDMLLNAGLGQKLGIISWYFEINFLPSFGLSTSFGFAFPRIHNPEDDYEDENDVIDDSLNENNENDNQNYDDSEEFTQ